MKIVVDTNIIFSAILNSDGKIAQLIIRGSKYFTLYSISQLNDEILEHKDKIMNLAGFSELQFLHAYKNLIGKIKFIDDIFISDKEFEYASVLTYDIDEDDTPFVALANSLPPYLWTGDKKLLKGLESKQFKWIISTDQLHDKFIKKEMKFLLKGKKKK